MKKTKLLIQIWDSEGDCTKELERILAERKEITINDLERELGKLNRKWTQEFKKLPESQRVMQ